MVAQTWRHTSEEEEGKNSQESMSSLDQEQQERKKKVYQIAHLRTKSHWRRALSHSNMLYTPRVKGKTTEYTYSRSGRMIVGSDVVSRRESVQVHEHEEAHRRCQEEILKYFFFLLFDIRFT